MLFHLVFNSKLKISTSLTVIPDRFQITLIISVVLLLQFVCYGSALLTYQNDVNDQLIFAHSICRHGDRNIYQIYPNDPWKSEKYWPGGYYQLTKLGKEQQYVLGQYLRKRYARLVDNDECAAINVQSTDKPRTIMSAQANLAGFFSSYSHSNCESISIHITPLKEDYILAVEKQCDHFDYLMIEHKNTTAYTTLFREHKSLIEQIEEDSGLKLRTLTNMNDLHDTLLVETFKNFRLPLWAEKVMAPDSDFEKLALEWYKVFTPTAEMKKLRSGYLLKELLNRFTNKVQSTLSSKRNLWMYFAHDITISSMLNTLGVFEPHMPPYASCIFFELYQHNNSPYVQVFYRNTTETKVPPINIPNCGTKCPLDRFYELYDDILPEKSFDDECVLREGESLPPFENSESSSL